MTFATINKQSSQQLSHIRYKAIISLVAYVLAGLFFLCAELTLADFLLYNNYLSSPYQLFVTANASVLPLYLALYTVKFLALTFCLANVTAVYCSNRATKPKRIAIFARLCLLRIVLTLAKIPFLLIFYISFAFFRNIITVYNAQSSQLAIAMLTLGAALCLYLMYIYLLLGMFTFPYLIANGERFFNALMRSYCSMKNKRGKLLKLILSSLPEALLIFTFPNILMRFAVFARHCTHDFDYLD